MPDPIRLVRQDQEDARLWEECVARAFGFAVPALDEIILQHLDPSVPEVETRARLRKMFWTKMRYYTGARIAILK